MLRYLSRIVIFQSFMLTAASLNAEVPFNPDQSFGGAVPEVGEVKPLRKAIGDMVTIPSSPAIKISGLITEVCQARGCWMILVDGNTHARVFFENYEFFVPIETSMQRAVLYGTLSEQNLSIEEANHFAEDAGKRTSIKQQGPIKEYAIVAKGVQIENKM